MANFWTVPIYTEADCLALIRALLAQASVADFRGAVARSYQEIPDVGLRYLDEQQRERLNALEGVLQSIRLGRPGFRTVPVED